VVTIADWWQNTERRFYRQLITHQQSRTLHVSRFFFVVNLTFSTPQTSVRWTIAGRGHARAHVHLHINVKKCKIIRNYCVESSARRAATQLRFALPIWNVLLNLYRSTTSQLRRMHAALLFYMRRSSMFSGEFVSNYWRRLWRNILINVDLLSHSETCSILHRKKITINDR